MNEKNETDKSSPTPLAFSRSGLPGRLDLSFQQEFRSTLQEISRSVGLSQHHRFHQMSSHYLRITAILPVPGTRQYLTSSFDLTIRLWDEESGLCLKIFTGHRKRIHSLVWLGEAFASAGEGEILIWNLEAGTPVEVFSPGEEWVILFLEFLPEKSALVCLAKNGMTGIWHLGEKRMAHVHKTEHGQGSCLAVSSDGNTLYTGFEDGTLLCLDSRLGSERVLWRGDDKQYPSAVREAGPGGELVAGLSNGEILVLDSTREKSRWQSSSTAVRSITMRPGYPDQCIVTHRLGLVQVINWMEGQIVHQYAPPIPNTRNICWSGDSTICYCGSHSVAEADFMQEKLVKVMPPLPRNEHNYLLLDEMVFSTDRSLMAVKGVYGLIALYDYREGVLLAYIDLTWEWDKEQRLDIDSMAFSPDNRYLAVAGRVEKGPVFIISVEERALVSSFSGWEAELMVIAFTPDCRELIVGGRAGSSLRKLTLEGLETGIFVGHEDSVFGIALSPDGRSLASCSADRTIRIWDVESCRLLKSIGIEGNWPNSIVYSEDGSRLAYCNSEGEILVLETGSYSPVFRMYQPMKFPLSVSLKRDGSAIAVGYLRDGIAVYSAEDGTLLKELQGARPQHYCGGINGKGDRILSGHFNIVQSWPFGECLNPEVLGRTHVADTFLAISPDVPILSIGGYNNSVSLLNLESLELRPNITQTRTDCELNFHGKNPDQVFFRGGGGRTLFGRALEDAHFTRYISVSSQILDALYDEMDNAVFILTDDGKIWYYREYVTILIWETEPDMEKIIRIGKNSRTSQLLLLGKDGGLYSLDSYDVQGTRFVRRFNKKDADGLMFTDNGKGVLVYGISGSVSLIQTSNGRIAARHTAPAGVRSLCQIPGTNRLALGLKNGMIQIVSGLKKEEHLFPAHLEGSMGVNSLVYYQEEDLLISSGHDGKICFWDGSSFELVGTFHLFENGFLWTIPPDDLAPEGWFWTNKKELVEVWEDSSRGREVMDPEESERYISLYNSRERVFQAIFMRKEYNSLISQSRSIGFVSDSAKMIEDGTPG